MYIKFKAQWRIQNTLLICIHSIIESIAIEKSHLKNIHLYNFGKPIEAESDLYLVTSIIN